MLAWPITLFCCVFMYPWVRRLLPERDRLLTAVVTFALSTGALSLILLGMGLIGLRIDWRIAFGLCVLIDVIGWLNMPHDAAPAREKLSLSWPALLVTGVAALILFNAIYWPFSIDDAVAIYAWYGRQIADSGALPPLAQGSLYEAYPMFVPLLYAFTHQAVGWLDEGLARLLPALMSVGVLAVAYLLGRTLYDRRAGLAAAWLAAAAPMVAHWASVGYVDLPCGFFFGLTALFAARWWQSIGQPGAWRDALLMGLMAGLATWTKNSGLLIVGSVGLWVVWRYVGPHPRPLSQRRGENETAPRSLSLEEGEGFRVRAVLPILLGFFLVAGPWYARNLLLAGVLVPPTGWTWLAERTLASLIPYLSDGRYFLSGVIFTLGLIFVAARAAISRLREWQAVLLLVFFLPFFVIWWALFSYDGRFLLAVTPIVAVMGGRLVTRVPLPELRNPARLAAALLLALLTLPAAWQAVDYKDKLLRHPLQTVEEKHRLVFGARYDIALRLRELPANANVLTSDTLLPYLALPTRVTVGAWPRSSFENTYNYWVLRPDESYPNWLRDFEMIDTVSGWSLLRVSVRR